MKVGTNSASYVPATTTVGHAYYYCVVTNTNLKVDGKTTATATSAVADIEVKKTPNAKILVGINYELTDGTLYKTVAPALYEVNDLGYVDVDPEHVAAFGLPENFHIVGNIKHQYPTTAGTLTFVIARDTLALALPTGVTANWTADASKGIAAGSAAANATTQVPVGAAVTLTGITGNFGKDGADLPDTSFTMNAAKTITEDDFGYYAVTVKSDVTVTDATFTSNGYAVAVSMETVYLKDAGNVTVKVAVTRNTSGSLGTARSVSVTGGTASNGTGLIAAAAYGTTPVEYDLTVAVTAPSDNVELAVTVFKP